MVQKYFPPSTAEVVSALIDLNKKYPDVYFGRDAIAHTIGRSRTTGKLVELVADKMVKDGVLVSVQCQYGLTVGSQRHVGYRLK